jgi:long-chain acyl-CoA synthetase
MDAEAPSNPFSYLELLASAKPKGIWAKTPDATVTNAEAVEKAKKIAYELRRLGVQRGDIVALRMADRLGIVFSLAVLHEAAVSTIVPDGWVPGGDLTVRWLLTTRDDVVGPPGATVVHVDQEFLQRIEENPYGIKPVDGPIEMIRIVFSSGTTGSPKAIAVGGPTAQQTAVGSLEAWAVGSPHLNLMDTGTAWGASEFYMSGYAGIPYLSVGGAPQAEIVRVAEENAVRRIYGSPAQVAALVDELERQGRTLPTVEAVVTTGTIMPPGLAERVRRVTEGGLVHGMYGSTEGGSAAIRRYESDDPYDAGQIMPGSTVEIVDDDDLVVPDGTIGRIRYRSFTMVDRYLGDPAASAKSFRDGWFYPGDLGLIRPDGGLTLAGRDAELLNAGGVKVDPNRLDQFALQRAGVQDACSFEYETASGVQGVGIALVAEDDLDIPALVADLKSEFKTAAPTLVARVETIPKTRNGKPMRRQLAESYRGS